VFLLQLAEKTERVFNASSTLTPDSMMSDESQSRDWQLVEPVAGCSSATGSLTDEPQFAANSTSESDVRQFGKVSAVAAESSVHDDSNKCERSDVTESPQLHNRCMLSGIDVSSTNSDPNISIGSADTSTDAELNDARLSATDGDSSVNSTLKGSDTDESSPKHSRTDVNMLQPTMSVSIPISTMFEMETKKVENTDVKNTDVKSSSGCEAVREAYSPISDAGDEATGCQTPVPRAGSVNSRPTVQEFSPISPFTPRPSAPNTPLPVVPLYWSRDASSATAAACDTSAWSINASLSESADIGKAQQLQSDVTVSASAPSRASDFTFKHYSSYPSHSGLSHSNLVRPTEVSAPTGHYQNVSFEQQHTAITSHHHYQQSESRYLGPVFPYRQNHSHSQQSYVHYADTVSDNVSAHFLYSANSQKQSAGSSVEAGKCNVSQPVSLRDTDTVSDQFATSSHSDVRSTQPVSSVCHFPSVTGQPRINNCDSFDRLQTRHNANTSIVSNG